MNAPTEEFVRACEIFGVELEPGETERLGAFLSLLYEANKRTNLTAIKTIGEAWTRHIFDALTLLPVLAECEPAGDRLLTGDVGSGGGVPALPLAIVRPDAHVTLIEAAGRKAEFLHAASRELGLENVEIVNTRAERAGTGELRDRFDVVTARALGRIAVAAELCVPLARVGGSVLLVKGQRADEELAEAKQALHALHAAHAGTVETPTGRIVAIEKTRPTPRKYPRRDGEPKRAPIGL